MTMYDRIKDLCESHGFAISFLADHVPNLDIKPSSINAWKNGSVPKKRKIYQIADYFGVTPEYLINGDNTGKATFSASVEIGDGNVIGDNNTVTTCTEQEQAILDIFKKLDIYKQAELLLYARKLEQESDQ